MGMAKRYWEMVDARGWEDVGTTICAECVVDEALIEAVKAHGGTNECDYCGKVPTAPVASAPFELVLGLVVDGLNHEYEDPVQQMAWDGGYVGYVQHTYELLWELDITESEKVLDELAGAIKTAEWCQRDYYAATPTQALIWGWSSFRTYVKHRRRFTFLTTDDSTADGAGSLAMHALPAAIARSVEDTGLTRHLPVGTTWWRIRPHSVSDSYSLAKDIGTPPDAVARDNRMSPKGIGAFYGASTAAGARAEVAGYADPAHVGTLGRFTTTAPLTVVDLRDLPYVPSLFDPDRRHLRAMTQFLHEFVKDATQVADPTDIQNLDYVPTQVIAETFRYDLPVDGILWRSSKDSAVTSCVLFAPSAEVADLGAETAETKLVLDPETIERISAPL
jgi:hypothetical protein